MSSPVPAPPAAPRVPDARRARGHVSLIDLPPAAGPLARLSMRVRLRLFAFGFGPVAELRGWSRWYQWRRHETPRARLDAVLRLLLLPARAARDARAVVREHARDVQRDDGGSAARQLVQLWWLRVRHGIITRSYFDGRLYRPERRPRAARHVQVSELTDVSVLLIRRAGGRAESLMLSNKRRFDDWCRQHDLRSVPTLIEVGADGATAGTVAPDRLPPSDLFAKPTNLRSGIGARRWRYDARRGYVDGDVVAPFPRDVVAHLVEDARRLGRPLIVQPCLQTHPALSAFAPGSLCTMRLVTFRSRDGRVETVVGALKMPVGGAVVDNVAQGAVVAEIDLASGRLGRAVRQRGAVFFGVDRHPDSGAEIRGAAIPDWAPTRALVERAHAATESAIVIGWDVAVLDDGPVLIEGNTLSGTRIMQVASARPLDETPLVRGLLDHLRASFGI